MKWKKLGLIFCPDNNYAWMVSHAAVPFVELISEETVRIYFSTRNHQGKSSSAFLETKLTNPQKHLSLTPKPILSMGEVGTFDEDGAMASWLVQDGAKKHLYYFGWNIGKTVPFRNAIGLAINEGNNFQKISSGPIIDRGIYDSVFVSNPCVIKEGDTWKMWYLSCIKWEIVNNTPKHHYHIKYAESADGINWDRSGVIAIDFKNPVEYAISRPCVIKNKDKYCMWYSYRGQNYRIGYAESLDGIHWQRLDDQVGIEVSRSGWDSEMIEYPCVFDHNGERYMLYNGNGYGKTGFGLAILEQD